MTDTAETTIADLGFSVLHNPQQPTADIVIIHGLGGHPYRSFAAKGPPPATSSTPGPSHSGTHTSPPKTSTKFWKRISRRYGSGNEKNAAPSGDFHWPRDFLPRDCQSARILVWGYDSNVTNGYSSSNKNDLFCHSRNLLYSLRREKPIQRPVIFVAHSLGGLVVKEMLRRSEISSEIEIQDIVKSTIGVIFFGTPHRGSPKVASLAEVIRNVAGITLRVDSNPSLIRALGIDSPELDLSRESFVTQWRKFGFKVKTFQEAYAPSGIKIGPLSKKTVPDWSSSLDDPREHAETLPADHENICKFKAATNIGYISVASELNLMLESLTDRNFILTQEGQAFLRTLSFDTMHTRRKNIRVALDDTCTWLFSTIEYLDWIGRKNTSKHHGLLWIKGKPGAGKSTLMKEALKRTELQNLNTGTTIAGFFFNARSTDTLQKTPLGLYQSILHQALQQDLKALAQFIPEFVRRKSTELKVVWHEEDLQRFFIQTFAIPNSRPAIIFIDALDECDDPEVRELVDFFRDLTTKAFLSGVKLNICFSSRHYPHISIKNCPEVIVERNNERDILAFIRKEANYIDTISMLQDRIFEKSQGVFLWVVLVVSMLKKSSYGKSLKWMEEKLDEIPPELHALFRQLFLQVDAEDAPKAVWLVQWILFAHGRIRLSMLHCIIGFAGRNPYPSIDSWKNSKDFLTSDAQLQMVISLSRGLIEPVLPLQADPDPNLQFIHESVREFFLKGSGFQLLDPKFSGSVLGEGHSTIARTCINYMQTSEVIKLSKLRLTELQRSGVPRNFKNNGHYLLRYAIFYLFQHIELAEFGGISQVNVLNRLLDENEALFRNLQFFHNGLRSLGDRRPLERLLCRCARAGLYCSTKRLLDMGQDLNRRSEDFDVYPLLAAASHFYFRDGSLGDSRSKYEVTKLLLERGADLRALNHESRTALHVAATAPIFLMLLKHGADPSAQDMDGKTPWQLVRESAGFQPSELEEIKLFMQKNGYSIGSDDAESSLTSQPSSSLRVNRSVGRGHSEKMRRPVGA